MPDLNQLLALHDKQPTDPFLTYGIALEHGKHERYDDAIAWLDKTLELDANYCYAYFQKAKMLDAQGDPDAAQAVLREGMTVAQTAGDAHAASEMAELLATIE